MLTHLPSEHSCSDLKQEYFDVLHGGDRSCSSVRLRTVTSAIFIPGFGDGFCECQPFAAAQRVERLADVNRMCFICGCIVALRWTISNMEDISCR